MQTITLRSETDFEGWRNAARSLLQQQVAPDQVHWRVTGSDGSLFDEPDRAVERPTPATFRVPREFLQLAQRVIVHRSPERFALLYRLLWRLQGEPRLLSVAVDEDVARAVAMAKSVRRDVHKMKAFVRFREVPADRGSAFVAWFEPEHRIVDAIAPFFMRRFAGQRWSILTPESSAHWDGEQLRFGPGVSRRDAPQGDAKEDLWRRYYASIFNPARLKVSTMRSQMPQKYWRNLPESQLIPRLVSEAEQRTASMIAAAPTGVRRAGLRPSQPNQQPSTASLEELRISARSCRACPLWANATQTVFGEGPSAARIAIVGEQPGDQEDLAGRPFVGPAGQLLDRALKQAGLPRSAVYVTNAVKHFKYELRGKRRLHKKPLDAEIAACHDWLERELAQIQPDLVIALGATAARSITGKTLGIERSRGHIIHRDGQPDLLITVHPSYLLRIPIERQDQELARFISDLELTRSYLHADSEPATPDLPPPQTPRPEDLARSPRRP
ncbi:MAG: UdgX family uracil-DNA binding protein [Steroidobacteraceae bacterium]